MIKKLFWHYKWRIQPVSGIFPRLDDRLLDPARRLADAKHLVNLALCGFGDRGFTNVQRTVISATEGRGNAL